MGQAHNYRCGKCGYSVDFMVDGYDHGIASRVHAISCRQCRELYVADLPGHPAELKADDVDQLVCPIDESHQTLPWHHPGPCPQCGETLLRGELIMLWD